jgi:NAD(P)-dependent dehydrogenase (short-subunit alcohol dehydrogenase family)
MRLAEKTAIVVGAGQTPGDTIGNGRATAILFAREGARVLAVDRNRESAEETAATIRSEGGECRVFEADVTREADCKAMVEACIEAWGKLDILHNNVGTGFADGGITTLTEAAWDHIYSVNLKSALFACKYAVPSMREKRAGVILNVSSIAAVCSMGLIGYKTSKSALNSLTHALAMGNAKYGIRANAIMPGLMNTPMAIEGHVAARGIDKRALIAGRDALVPLGGKMGTAWDVAYAALFLASDEAKFITGILLPVDGGQSAKIG